MVRSGHVKMTWNKQGEYCRLQILNVAINSSNFLKREMSSGGNTKEEIDIKVGKRIKEINAKTANLDVFRVTITPIK